VLPSRIVECPYCGESIELILDDSVDHQQYVEDCSVCCRPINVDVAIDESDVISLRLSTDSEA
jgi:hypothetical protein